MFLQFSTEHTTFFNSLICKFEYSEEIGSPEIPPDPVSVISSDHTNFIKTCMKSPSLL